jgi:hypothetical protein
MNVTCNPRMPWGVACHLGTRREQQQQPFDWGARHAAILATIWANTFDAHLKSKPALAWTVVLSWAWILDLAASAMLDSPSICLPNAPTNVLTMSLLKASAANIVVLDYPAA